MLQGVDLSMNDSCYPFWENTVEIICQDTCKIYQESSRIYRISGIWSIVYGPQNMTGEPDISNIGDRNR